MPSPKSHTPICAVGTSVLTNIERDKDHPDLAQGFAQRQGRVIRHRRFYIRPSTSEQRDDTIVGEYKDSEGFGARFAVQTTAKNRVERIAAIEDLNRRFGNE